MRDYNGRAILGLYFHIGLGADEQGIFYLVDIILMVYARQLLLQLI